MIPFILFIVFVLVTDIYSFFGLKQLFDAKPFWFNLLYTALSIFVIIGIIIMYNSFSKLPTNQSFSLNIVIGLTFSVMVAKVVFSSFFMVEDLFRIFIWIFQSALKFRLTEFIPRSFIWGAFNFSFGTLLLILLNYGVVIGKYHYKVHHKVLHFNNLPESFNGFKIAQISDMHLGTFDNINKVKKGLKKINNENPDLIVFTGDMVNNKADEAYIYIDAIKELTAPFGKYTIMGNHDYGDYMRWNNKQERMQNIQNLETLQKQMGFKWLKNQHVPLVKNNDTIYLAGVENWGLPPFPQYGNINTALSGVQENKLTILLSHDPTHWQQKVVNNNINVALTLSGHTHGMQFGIELGKFKWSPVKYKYPEWAGLYENKGKYLYVNRGFGNIGYPGRLGIRPEITIIELRRK